MMVPIVLPFLSQEVSSHLALVKVTCLFTMIEAAALSEADDALD